MITVIITSERIPGTPAEEDRRSALPKGYPKGQGVRGAQEYSVVGVSAPMKTNPPITLDVQKPTIKHLPLFLQPAL